MQVFVSSSAFHFSSDAASRRISFPMSIFVILGTEDILRLAGTLVVVLYITLLPSPSIKLAWQWDVLEMYYMRNSIGMPIPALLPLSQLVLSMVPRHASLTPIFYCFVKNMLLAPHFLSGFASSIHCKRVVGL